MLGCVRLDFDQLMATELKLSDGNLNRSKAEFKLSFFFLCHADYIPFITVHVCGEPPMLNLCKCDGTNANFVERSDKIVQTLLTKSLFNLCSKFCLSLMGFLLPLPSGFEFQGVVWSQAG